MMLILKRFAISFVLVLLLILESVCHGYKEPYYGVCVASSLPQSERKCYLIICNRLGRLISDKESVETLNLNPSEMVEMTEGKFKETYTIGDPLPRIAYSDKSPDDAVRIYTLRSSIMNGDDLFIDYSNVGEYMNPSVLKFRDRLLMLTPLQIGFTGSEHRPKTGTIEFKWLNSSLYPFHTVTKHLGVENEVHALNELLFGEDPRVQYFNESYFQVYYTYIPPNFNRHAQKMGVAEVRYIAEERSINITYRASPIIPVHPLDSTHSQKNWSPFLYNGQTYLVQSIHPLIVVELQGLGSPEVSAVIKSKFMYEYENGIGELRGGTNAIRLHDRYLAFYHIRTRLPWNSMTSYVYGAYTFSLEPPFRVLTVSPTPIMEPRELWSQRWSSRYIDYCVYPMHIFLVKHDVLHISFGYQDRWGFVGTMNLTKLLDTMVNITTSSTSTSS